MDEIGPPPKKKFKQAKLSFAAVAASRNRPTPETPQTSKNLEQAQSSQSKERSPQSLDTTAEVAEPTLAEPTTSSSKHKYDIGNYLKKDGRSLDDQRKNEILTNCWEPDPSYKFPPCAKSKRRFQYSWLKTFNWLSCSERENGGFYKPCVIFAPEFGGVHGNQKLKTTLFHRYKDAISDLIKHANTKYHSGAIIAQQNYMQMSKEKTSVIEKLDSTREEQVAKNRSCLRPIIKTIVFLGKQEIALRGHRDSGNIATDEEDAAANDGNFRAALRFRVDAGDMNLKNHLKNAGANSTYISWNIQNEITTIGDMLTDGIIQEVKEAKYFSILVDETTDCSANEFISQICSQ